MYLNYIIVTDPLLLLTLIYTSKCFHHNPEKNQHVKAFFFKYRNAGWIKDVKVKTKNTLMIKQVLPEFM